MPAAAEDGEQGFGDRQFQRVAVLGLINPEVTAAHTDAIPGELEHFGAAQAGKQCHVDGIADGGGGVVSPVDGVLPDLFHRIQPAPEFVSADPVIASGVIVPEALAAQDFGRRFGQHHPIIGIPVMVAGKAPHGPQGTRPAVGLCLAALAGPRLAKLTGRAMPRAGQALGDGLVPYLDLFPGELEQGDRHPVAGVVVEIGAVVLGCLRPDPIPSAGKVGINGFAQGDLQFVLLTPDHVGVLAGHGHIAQDLQRLGAGHVDGQCRVAAQGRPDKASLFPLGHAKRLAPSGPDPEPQPLHHGITVLDLLPLWSGGQCIDRGLGEFERFHLPPTKQASQRKGRQDRSCNLCNLNI
ncbi:hypothetical protein LGKMAHEF_00782 [Aeromonas salmonicida]